MSIEELEVLFEHMLKDSEGIDPADMKDMEVFKINWNICGLTGYQIFKKDDYSYKIGEYVDDPDVSIEIDDVERAIPFLKSESVNYGNRYRGKGKYVLVYTVGWKEYDDPEKGRMRERDLRTFITAQFYKTRGTYTPMMFNKLPMFKNLRIGMDEEDKNQYGAYIPINRSLGAFENQILPGKIFKYFIDKASHIVVRDCGCREAFKCSDHDISLGCMYLGDDVLQVIDPVPLNGVRVVNKQEALDHVQRAIDNGLVPILGRVVGELQGFGKDDTGHNLSCCFCCTCCCINGKMISSASEKSSSIYRKLEGLRIEVDQEKCIGCELCMEVCVFKGMEMVDDEAHIREKFCLGCGRCANVCPHDAISIEIDDKTRLDEFIGKIESYVDVEDRSMAKEKS
ncbi:MAG: 4Fe-4S dicluster domain-containing protein [Promethearchaeota archaeon]|jgi:UDP-glucose 4-epimerase